MVGASDTSNAFLESLVFSPHLYFTNLTLVSPRSFYLPSPPPRAPSEDSPALPEWSVTSSSLCFTHKQYSLLGLRTWVNSVKQKMVAINRWVWLGVVGEGRWNVFGGGWEEGGTTSYHCYHCPAKPVKMLQSSCEALCYTYIYNCLFFLLEGWGLVLEGRGGKGKEGGRGRRGMREGR